MGAKGRLHSALGCSAFVCSSLFKAADSGPIVTPPATSQLYLGLTSELYCHVAPKPPKAGGLVRWQVAGAQFKHLSGLMY